MALTGYQVAEARLHQAKSIWDLPEVADDNDSDSIGSMSPDLGDMWRCGFPKSLDWNGDVELDSVEEEDEEDGESTADRILTSD